MKWYSRIAFIMTALLCIVILSACEKQRDEKDAKQVVSLYVKNLEKASEQRGAVKVSQKTILIKQVTYDVANMRDPFEMPSMTKNTKQYPNTILRNAALDSLKLSGILLQDNQRWAVFRANDGKLYKMTVGMRIGIQQALLTQILQNKVIFSIDGSTPDEPKHMVSMSIQEFNP